MARVGVRELRQRDRELLRRAEGGETIELTDRGGPIALLGPLPGGCPLEQLRRSSEINEATGDIDDLLAPLPSTGPESPSAVLARLRRRER